MSSQRTRKPDRRFAYLIRCGAQLAGFALAKRGSVLTDDPNDLDVLFVRRRHRRAGVGRRAAFLLWDALPGHWTVRVADNNDRALGFWRATVSAYRNATRSRLARPRLP